MKFNSHGGRLTQMHSTHAHTLLSKLSLSCMLSCSWYICLFCYTFGKSPKNKTCVAVRDRKIWSATYWYLSVNGLEIIRRGLMGYVFCSEQALKLWISWVQRGSSSQFWVSCKCCMVRCLLFSILKYPICNKESGIQKPSCSSPRSHGYMQTSQF